MKNWNNASGSKQWKESVTEYNVLEWFKGYAFVERGRERGGYTRSACP